MEQKGRGAESQAAKSGGLALVWWEDSAGGGSISGAAAHLQKSRR